jgi:AAA+ ATPase superfamily predicted ATPase
MTELEIIEKFDNLSKIAFNLHGITVKVLANNIYCYLYNKTYSFTTLSELNAFLLGVGIGFETSKLGSENK